MQTQRLPFFFLLFFSFTGFSQDRPLIYFGETPYGSDAVANMNGPRKPALNDLNNDGITDSVVSMNQKIQVATAILRNGEFDFLVQPNSYFQNGNKYLRIQFGGLSSDGYQNAAFCNGYLFPGDGYLEIPFKSGSSHLELSDEVLYVEYHSDSTIPFLVASVPYKFDLFTTDRNKNGLPELWVKSGKKFMIGELNGHQFENYSSFFPDLAPLSSITSTISGDFDKDGLEDLIYGESNHPAQIKMLKGRSDTSFFPQVILADGFNLCLEMQIVDLNRDGWDDFIASGGNRFTVFVNQGNGVFTQHTLTTESTESWDFMDPNFDNFPDLAITVVDSIHIYLNDHQANFELTGKFAGVLPKLKQKVTNEFYRFSSSGSGTNSTHYLERIGISPDADIYQSKAFRTFDGSCARTSYQIDYDLDGMPDFLCNSGNNAYIYYGDTAGLDRVDFFENTKLVGFIDINQDSFQDVFWEIGSCHFVELIDAPLPAAAREIKIADLNIFPNPAYEFIHFDLLDPSSLKWVFIYDSQGKLVQSVKEPGRRINISHLPTGTYYLKGIRNLRNQFSGQFLKVD